MERYMAGRRYAPRHQYPHRAYPHHIQPRRRPGRNAGRIRPGRLLKIQSLICAVLLLVIIAAKSLDIAAADFITNKVRYALEYNVELKSIYAHAEALVSDIRSGFAANEGKTAMLSAEELPSGTADASSGTPGADADVDAAASAGGGTGAGADVYDGTEGNDVVAVQPGNDGIYDDGEYLHGYEGADDTASSGGGDILVYNETETRVLAASSGVDDAPDEDPASGRNGVLSDAENHGDSNIKDGDSGIKDGDFNMIALVKGRLVTPFGEIEGAAGMRKMHYGIDIAVDKISGVMAVLDGRVEDTGSSPHYGRFIKIRHSDSLVAVYANCSSIAVDTGDIVRKGEVIAGAGGERVDCGSHIHFEVWLDGIPADPLDFIDLNIR